MTRKEVSERFNALPKGHRITIIANELETKIRWLEREKREYIKAHKLNMKRIDERIEINEECLKKLK